MCVRNMILPQASVVRRSVESFSSPARAESFFLAARAPVLSVFPHREAGSHRSTGCRTNGPAKNVTPTCAVGYESSPNCPTSSIKRVHVLVLKPANTDRHFRPRKYFSVRSEVRSMPTIPGSRPMPRNRPTTSSKIRQLPNFRNLPQFFQGSHRLKIGVDGSVQAQPFLLQGHSRSCGSIPESRTHTPTRRRLLAFSRVIPGATVTAYGSPPSSILSRSTSSKHAVIVPLHQRTTTDLFLLVTVRCNAHRCRHCVPTRVSNVARYFR